MFIPQSQTAWFSFPYWSFVWKTERPSLMEGLKLMQPTFQPKTAVFGRKPRFLKNCSFAKTTVFSKNHGFWLKRRFLVGNCHFYRKLWFSRIFSFLPQISTEKHRSGQTKDHLPRKVTPTFKLFLNSCKRLFGATVVLNSQKLLLKKINVMNLTTQNEANEFWWQKHRNRTSTTCNRFCSVSIG